MSTQSENVINLNQADKTDKMDFKNNNADNQMQPNTVLVDF